MGAVGVFTGVVLAACSSGSSGTSNTSDGGGTATAPPSTTSPTTSAPPTTSAAPATTATPTVTGTTVKTSLDPCQLVTSAEASALAGVSYGPGKEENTANNSKVCVYGYQTTNVFTVELAQASSAATAQAAFSQAQAEAQRTVKQQAPSGVNTSLKFSVASVGDRAATVHVTASLGGQTFGISGIYVLKGATFFAFQDLVVGKNPPSVAALTTEAKTVVTRV